MTVYFVDPNHSTVKARVTWRDLQKANNPDITGIELSDEQRIAIVNNSRRGTSRHIWEVPTATSA